MVLNTMIAQVIVALMQFIIGLIVALGSIYFSIKLLDRFTAKLEEWKELKKGNLAVGVFIGGFIVSMGIIIQTGVAGILRTATPGMSMNMLFLSFGIGLINLIIGVVAGVLGLFIAIRALNWFTKDIDDMAELRKGNVAVAIMIVAVLVSVSFIISGAVNGISGAINASEILQILGL